MRGSLIDLTGKQFGRWTVLTVHPESKPVRWRCRCDCGIERTVYGSNLRSGHSLSCGCFRRDQTARRFTKHGHTRNGKEPRSYSCWRSMLQRCLNPNHPAFANYGGRGITVCQRRHDFRNFYADVGDVPAGLSIDRIDNNRGYEPGNVRWATAREQLLNRRPFKRERRRAQLEDILTYAAALKRAAISNVGPNDGQGH
jgi:hypothetical protein